MSKIGYARVSTLEQNEQRQLNILKELGAEKIFTDKQSGKDANREALNDMLDYIRKGDVVVVESISRAARNAKDLLDIVEKINAKEAEFISVKEAIDTTTVQGKFMLTVFAAMAELERGSILERQREGIAVAKAEGKYRGKPKQDYDEVALKKQCKRWRAGEQTAVETMKKVGMKPNTFYRRVKELGL